MIGEKLKIETKHVYDKVKDNKVYQLLVDEIWPKVI
ncbi:hypothetical protein GIHI108528_07145 [Gillisia hiemivivida]